MEVAPNGVIPAIPTPFTPDGRSVDEAALRRVVRHVVEGGVHGIMTTGGTGEFPHLSREERRLVTGLNRRNAARIPRASFVEIPDCGHLVPWEKRETLLEAVRPFLFKAARVPA